jgi:hypothetical protein
MTANSRRAASPAGPYRMQDLPRTFRLPQPSRPRLQARLMIGVIAAAGIFGSASADEPDAVEAATVEAPTVEAVPQAVPETAQVSAADRLRGDAVQMATVPVPVVKPPPAVRLTPQERILARHISRSYRVTPESIERFVHYAYKAAREVSLDPHLLLAVMAVESGFDPEARSAAGAEGLMQIHTRVHARRLAPYGGAEAATDPVVNIAVGARILSEYVKRYGDVSGGLKAYVGAAQLQSDGGYGSKVLTRQAEFDAVLQPDVPVMQARAEEASSGAGGSVEAAGGQPWSSGSGVGL